MTTYLKKSWSMTLLFAREKNSFKYIGKPHFYYGFPLSSVCVYVHVKFDVKKKFPLLTHWLMHMPWKQLHYLPALLTGFLPSSPFDFTSPFPCTLGTNRSPYSYLTLHHGMSIPRPHTCRHTIIPKPFQYYSSSFIFLAEVLCTCMYPWELVWNTFIHSVHSIVSEPSNNFLYPSTFLLVLSKREEVKKHEREIIPGLLLVPLSFVTSWNFLEHLLFQEQEKR